MRQEIGRHYPGGERTVSPDNFIEEIVEAPGGRQQRGPRGPLHRIAAQAPEHGAALVVEHQVSGKNFRSPAYRFRGFLQPRMAHQLVGHGSGEPQTLPPEGQIGHPVIATSPTASLGHDLEAAVQEQRMHFDAASVNGLGQRQFAHRFAVRGPQRPQGAERRTELYPCARPRAVELRDVSGFQTGLQAFQVNTIGPLRPPGF